MAKEIGTTTDYIGSSTETKPIECGPGSTFYETDTKLDWIFDGTTWWQS